MMPVAGRGLAAVDRVDEVLPVDRPLQRLADRQILDDLGVHAFGRAGAGAASPAVGRG